MTVAGPSSGRSPTHCDRGLDQPPANLIAVELAASNQLIEPERAAIERTIVPVGALASGSSRIRVPPCRRRPVAREIDTPSRAHSSITPVSIATAWAAWAASGRQAKPGLIPRRHVDPAIDRAVRVHGRRRQDVATLTSDVEAKAYSARAGLDRTGRAPPKMRSGARDHVSVDGSGPYLASSLAKAAAPMAPSTSRTQTPDMIPVLTAGL